MLYSESASNGTINHNDFGMSCPSGLFRSSASKSLFLVFDEIGKPFARSHEDFAETQQIQMEEFQQFLSESIFPLLMSRTKVFVLLCGRAPFLDWVGTTPHSMLLSSIENGTIVKAKRISLNMIRPDSICDILSKTLFYDADLVESKPIYEFLGLSDTDSIRKYAELLYEITGGHPRTLYEILNHRCTTIMKNKIPLLESSSLELSDDFLSREALSMIQKTALRFNQSTRMLIEEFRNNHGVSKLIDSISPDGIRFSDFLPALRIGYQRTSHESVKLTIPRRILLMLEELMSPSNMFLTKTHCLCSYDPNEPRGRICPNDRSSKRYRNNYKQDNNDDNT